MTHDEIRDASNEALTARETVLRGAILATWAPGRSAGQAVVDTARRPAMVEEWQAVKAEVARREADYQAWAEAERAKDAANEADYQAWYRETYGEVA